MKTKILKLYNIIINVIQWTLTPIINNMVLFITIIFLLTIPLFINVLFINPYLYLFTVDSKIQIKYEYSIPYIFEIPTLFSYLLCVILQLLTKINKFVYFGGKILLYILIISLYSINIFLLLNFNTIFTPFIIVLLNETNNNEINDFFQSYVISANSMITYIIILITISIIYYLEKRKLNIIKIKQNRIYLIFSFIVVACICERGYIHFLKFTNIFNCNNLGDFEYCETIDPSTNIGTQFIYSIYINYVSKKEIKEAVINTVNASNLHINNNKNKIINIVLIIGESYNKHHSNLYGYYKDTNPLLNKEIERNNLFVFKNVISPYNLTSFVMRNLFSTNSIMDRESWSSYPAFPVIFRKAGYNVYLWDNQNSSYKDATDYSIAAYIYDPKITKLSYNACNKSCYHHDLDLFNSFKKSVPLNLNNKNLIIFHLIGQHMIAKRRYPHNKQFEYFTKDSINRPDLPANSKMNIANYDNATRYNDYVIYNIINYFRKSNSVIVYLSDHGEELYDYRNSFGRSFEPNITANRLKYQYEVPFMVWCSDSYIKNNPQKILLIKNAEKKPFMIDNTCQALFGLCNLKNKFYHPNRDLFNEHFNPYKYRRVNDNTNYEKIRWGK